MTSKYGRGGGRGQGRLGPPPASRVLPLGRGMGMAGKSKGRPARDGAAAEKAAAAAVVPAANAVEETFQMLSDGTPAAYAILAKLTPGLWEELSRVKGDGGSLSMKFGSSPSGAGVLKVGSEEIRFSSAREPGHLFAIYEEQQRGESGNGILAEAGAVWRKISVNRTLDAGESNRVKERSAEAERKQKSRKAIVLEPSSSLKNQVAAANDGGSGRKFMQNRSHQNAMQMKESLSKGRPAATGGAAGKNKVASIHPVGTIKPKLAAPVSPEVIAAAPRLPNPAPAPAGTMLPPKGRSVVEEAPPPAVISKPQVSSPAAVAPPESVPKSGAAVNGGDLRNCLITLLTDNPKGMSMKALERALGDCQPSLQAARKKNMEKILKQIATFIAPGKYLLKQGVEKGVVTKPSGNSPDFVPVDSPSLADSPAPPDVSSDVPLEVVAMDEQDVRKEATEAPTAVKQFQRPPIRKTNSKTEEGPQKTASAVRPDVQQKSSQAFASPDRTAMAPGGNQIREDGVSADNTPSRAQEVPSKTPDDSDGGESTSSGSGSDSDSGSGSGSESGSGSDSDSDTSSSSGDDDSADEGGDEDVNIVSDDENEKPKGENKEPSPHVQRLEPTPPWNAEQLGAENLAGTERPALAGDDEDDEEIDVVSSEGAPPSPRVASLIDNQKVVADVPGGQHESVDRGALKAANAGDRSTDDSRKCRSSESDNSIEALEMKAQNRGARRGPSIDKDRRGPAVAKEAKPSSKDISEGTGLGVGMNVRGEGSSGKTHVSAQAAKKSSPASAEGSQELGAPFLTDSAVEQTGFHLSQNSSSAGGKLQQHLSPLRGSEAPRVAAGKPKGQKPVMKASNAPGGRKASKNVQTAKAPGAEPPLKATDTPAVAVAEHYRKNHGEPSLLGRPGPNVETFPVTGRDQYEMHGWPNNPDQIRRRSREFESSKRQNYPDRAMPGAELQAKRAKILKSSGAEQAEESGMLSDGEIREGVEDRGKLRSDRESGELDDIESGKQMVKDKNEAVKDAAAGEALSRMAGRVNDVRRDSPAKRSPGGTKDGQRSDLTPVRLEAAVTGKPEAAVGKGADTAKGKVGGRGTKRTADAADGHMESRKAMKKESNMPSVTSSQIVKSKTERAGGGVVSHRQESAKRQMDHQQARPSSDSVPVPAKMGVQKKESSADGFSAKKRTVARDPVEDQWFAPYEKLSEELQGPIGNMEEYKRCVTEYGEKYDVYLRLNTALQRCARPFDEFRAGVDQAKAAEDKIKLAAIYGDLTDAFIDSRDRFKRMRHAFLGLHKQLSRLKSRIKEYADKVQPSRPESGFVGRGTR